MEIKIINANEEYYEDMFQMHNEVMPEQDKMTRNCFFSEFNEDTRKYFIALDENNKLVGYIGVLDTTTDYNIMGIAVGERYKRKGVGTKLIQYIKTIAQQEKVETLSLEVDQTNTSAIKFYEKMGFVLTNIRKKYYKNNDAYIMWYYL